MIKSLVSNDPDGRSPDSIVISAEPQRTSRHHVGLSMHVENRGVVRKLILIVPVPLFFLVFDIRIRRLFCVLGREFMLVFWIALLLAVLDGAQFLLFLESFEKRFGFGFQIGFFFGLQMVVFGI